MINLNSRSAPATPKNILLIDDNRNGLTARKTVLAELGYCITTATKPGQALEYFRGGSFDLVITAYDSPEMKAMELIGHIRAGQPAVPIILISGYMETLGLNEANTRADAVIQKSANEVSHLVMTVSRLLRKKARKPAGSQSRISGRSKRRTGSVS